VVHQSLSYGWSEVGREGAGGLVHCRQISSPGETRQLAMGWWSFVMHRESMEERKGS